MKSVFTFGTYCACVLNVSVFGAEDACTAFIKLESIPLCCHVSSCLSVSPRVSCHSAKASASVFTYLKSVFFYRFPKQKLDGRLVVGLFLKWVFRFDAQKVLLKLPRQTKSQAKSSQPERIENGFFHD